MTRRRSSLPPIAPASFATARSVPGVPSIPSVPSVPSIPSVPSVPGLSAASASAAQFRAEASGLLHEASPTGEEILQLSMTKHGQAYVLGARAPMGNSAFDGPWDCAEFCSWCVYHAAGILFGVRPTHDVMRADAYTGYWAEDSALLDCRVPLDQALATPGALLLRPPSSLRGGHIAFSDGNGGTSEAKGRKFGVGAFTALRRGWDYGVLVPGVRYFKNQEPVVAEPMPQILKLTSPMMRGPAVLAVQRQLMALGFAAGTQDGIYGPQTEAAVIAFQDSGGLTADGEVGPETLEALNSAAE